MKKMLAIFLAFLLIVGNTSIGVFALDYYQSENENLAAEVGDDTPFTDLDGEGEDPSAEVGDDTPFTDLDGEGEDTSAEVDGDTPFKDLNDEVERANDEADNPLEDSSVDGLYFQDDTDKEGSLKSLANIMPLNSGDSFTIYANDNKDNYLSGEDVVTYVHFNISGANTLGDKVFLKVKIPNEYIANVTATDIDQQVSKTITQIGDDYFIIYEFNKFTEGVNLDIPIKVVTNNGMTPNGYKLNISATLVDENDRDIFSDISEISKEYTINTIDYEVDKQISSDGNYFYNSNGVSITGGLESSNNEGYLSNNPSDLSILYFHYQLNRNINSSTFGSRFIETVTITDILPEYAYFDPDLNEGWVYNETTREVTYSYTLTTPKKYLGIHQYLDPILKLKFPEHPIGKINTNQVKVELTAPNQADYENNIVLEDDITFKIGKDQNISTLYITKTRPPQGVDIKEYREKEIPWTISVSNEIKSALYGAKKLENVKLTDKNLNPKLKFTKLTFNKENFVNGSIKISILDKDNIKTVLNNEYRFEDIDANSVIELVNGENIKEVIIEFNDGTYLYPEEKLSYVITTELIDKDADVIEGDEKTANLYNTLVGSGNYEGISTINRTISNWKTFIKYKPSLSLEKLKVTTDYNYLQNQTVDFRLNVVAHNFLSSITTFDVNKIVDILPDGVDYVAGSAKVTKGARVEIIGLKSNEPEIIENFKGTGKTALVWELEEFNSTNPTEEIIYTLNSIVINYKVTVNKYANIGINTNDAYLSWKDASIIGFDEDTTVKDIFDLNENGSTDDDVAYSSAEFGYIPPKELINKKEVKGSLDTDFVGVNSVGYGELTTDLEVV